METGIDVAKIRLSHILEKQVGPGAQVGGNEEDLAGLR
jgi:hypothetical protein